MAQTSKIMEVQASSILQDIFAVGNKIALSTTNPNEATFTEPTASSYVRYTIQTGDFTASSGAITNAKHLLYGLCDDEGGWETVKAFGVYKGSSLIYWGLLAAPQTINYNTVPVFKKYNMAAGEGIKVTLDIAAAASVSS